MAILLDARLLVLLTDIDGLHTRRPAAASRAPSWSPRSTDFAELEGCEIGDRTSAFGSGGMRSKVAAAEMASEAGIPAVICNGTAAGTLLERRGRRGRSAPASPPRRRKASSFKLWLKYAKPARGRLVVDEGAARVLRESGSSLLPVGIAAVEGASRPATRSRSSRTAASIGKGIANYSSARAARRCKGMKSAEVRELLPHAAEEAIHRDSFVPDLGAVARGAASGYP